MFSIFRFFKKPKTTPNTKNPDPSKEINILDLHFLYQEKIETYYREREKPGYLDMAVSACKDQISIAPAASKAFKEEEGWQPGHKGYNQLAIIFEKEGRFQEAINLSQQAKSQGWDGDWDKRIARCDNKLKKEKP